MNKATGNKKSKVGTKNKCKNTEGSAHFPGLVDLARSKNKVVYLCKTAEGLKTISTLAKEQGQCFIPPDFESIPFEILPDNEILKHLGDKDFDLYWDLYGRLKEISSLPSEEYYHLIIVFIFSTYLQEKFSYFAILWFYGHPETGKSRIMKAISILSYRGFYTETLNQAYMFRLAHLFHATLVVDVYDLIDQAHKKNSYDLLLGRYERGLKVPRVLALDKGDFNDTKYYDVFGPTVFGTNIEIPVNDPLRSRSLQIIMTSAPGKYPNNNSSDALIDLKARLLAFRARWLDRPLPSIEKPINGRLGDITHPLLSVARLLPPEASSNLMVLIENLETQRNEAEAETLGARIAQALYELQDEIKNGRLPFSALHERLREDNQPMFNVQAIGRELTLLSIKRMKSMGTMHIIWDQEAMRRIWERYSIPLQ